MKRKWNRIFSFALALALMFSLSLTAYAHEAVDMNRSSSITVTVKYDGKGIPDAKFTCIQMAYVQEIKGTESGFHFFRLFDDVMIENDRVTDDAENLAKELEGIYKDNRDRFDFREWTLKTGEDGQVTFNSLEPGLYLIRQPAATYGYSKMAPFLVSVPYVVKDNGDSWHYEYDVSASAKSELEREPVPTKPPHKPDPNLPQTGQLNWPVPLLAVSGMAFFAVGWLIYGSNGKKRDG